MPAKLTTKIFIEKAKLKYGEKYDYSLVEYENSGSKIKIICPYHGLFFQISSDHLSKNGCPECGEKLRIEKRTSTTEEFIEKAKLIHENRYDYSLVEYVRSDLEIKIICPEHGEFFQKPKNHLLKYGCFKCGKIILKKKFSLNKEEFIKRSKEIHGNLYDYSLTQYENCYTKIKIICPVHGIFEQKPNGHLIGHGCSECSGNKKSTTEEFIIKAKLVHGNEYDYSLVEYTNNSTNIKIICENCKEIFEQTPNAHLSGCGCLKCYGGSVSKIETKWLDYEKIPKEYRQQDVIINNKTLTPDAFIPETNTIYECLGDFWHGNPDVFNLNDINPIIEKTYGQLYQKTIDRLKLFRENGYKVIYIWESEWKNYLKWLKWLEK